MGDLISKKARYYYGYKLHGCKSIRQARVSRAVCRQRGILGKLQLGRQMCQLFNTPIRKSDNTKIYQPNELYISFYDTRYDV